MSLPFKFLSLPIAVPSASEIVITSPYGGRNHPVNGGNDNHRAVDIAARRGTPLLAVLPGRVILTGNLNDRCGHGIVIAHKTNPRTDKETHATLYCHMEIDSSANFNLQPGSQVAAGQIVGRVGSTGTSTGPHLHFGLREIRGNTDNSLPRSVNSLVSFLTFGDKPIDPTPFLQDLITVRIRGEQAAQTPAVQVGRQSPAAITPFIESLESFHPKIQYELTRRRIAAETANTYMPFVKLTSLTKVLSENLQSGTEDSYCPSLGIHGQPDISFDEIYYPQNNRSIIAYAVSDNGDKIAPVVVKDSRTDQANIPMPGITALNVERGTAGAMGVRGGLVRANLKIVAYSVGQMDALLRYFLRPATRVVLEIGRKSSSKQEVNLQPFNWNQPLADIKDYFNKLIVTPELQKEFIEKYIYGNYGRYEAFVGYVVKFNMKYTKNNTYEIDLAVHSVQQYEVPTKHTGVTATCPNPTANCKVMDIQEYFSESESWKNNSFSKLMSTYLEDDEWKSQIVPIKNSESTETGAASTNAGTRDNEYFVTWNFFVEKLLNDRQYGVASILASSGATETMTALSLPRIVAEPTSSANTGLISGQVGYHPDLRSVNPAVMIIYNKTAQTTYNNSRDAAAVESLVRQNASGSLQGTNAIFDKIVNGHVNFTNVLDTQERPGASYLSRGVWLNTAAIKQAFSTTDTVSAAISSLLSMMNTATEGYWNLQLYSTDVQNPGMHIIDMGLSKKLQLMESRNDQGSTTSLTWFDEEEVTASPLSSVSSIVSEERYRMNNTNTPKYIYMFNRKTKRFADGELGSDLLDVNIEFNLPQVIAVQAIANIGGPAQKSLLQSIDIPELRQINLIDAFDTPCSNDGACFDSNQICTEDTLANLAEKAEEARREYAAAQQARVDEVNRIGNNNAGRIIAVNPYEGRIGQQYKAATDAYINALDNLKIEGLTQDNPNAVGLVREYASLGTAILLIEINPSRMLKKMNLDSTRPVGDRQQPTVHSFNSSNLTKTVAEVTLPGIGGIFLFQSFWIDRVPSILERGFYVVTKVTHDFTTQNGWITKIEGRFRFRPTKDELAKEEPAIICP